MIDRRLAHYEITAHLGSGGMGDVYQATDTKLGRRVALKFLPEPFAHDPDRSARFAREARTLASLNHPHIAAIHGIEEADGKTFLVMELVPGRTLAERIRHGRVPLDEAIAVARQIAEALEAAHEKGIVHRDLKPANVKVTPDGRAKVLDFGLAKLADGDSGADAPGLANSPTITSPATIAGVVLGTAAYMAPEQARGRPVDQRADIFAFGCVLYEMLAGRPAFDGQSVADIVSRVLQRDPDWSLLPADVPPSVHRLLRLCLEKDPKKRRQAAGDVRIDLEQALAEPVAAAADLPASHRGSRWPRLAWIGGALAAMAALTVPAVRHFREVPPRELRLEAVTPPTLLPYDFALSPDGKSIVYSALDDKVQRLYLRALDRSEAEPVAGTESGVYPFWSPDSRSIGFFAAGQLRRVDVAGGPSQVVAPAQVPRGATWGPDGTIVFAPNTVSPLMRVAASGGTAVPLTKLDTPRQTGHSLPSFLPDGRRFLFYAVGDPQVAGIFLGSLDGRAPVRLTEADSNGAFHAPDLVVFVGQGKLVARRLDASRGELTGEPLTLAPVAAFDPTSHRGAFSISTSGMIAHRRGAAFPARMAWFSRTGTITYLADGMNAPDLSPDERRLAFDRIVDGNRDIWIMDLVRGGLSRFTVHPAVDGFPLWSPDGTRLAFESTRNGTFDLWIRPASGAGAEELLFQGPDAEWPLHWSRDGRFLLFQQSDLKAKADVLALPMTGADRSPLPVADTPFVERMGEFSPDGRWIVYATNESGRFEVVAQAFPTPSGRLPVSTHGGDAPRWRADGKEIYYLAPDGKLMAVPVKTTETTFEAGTPMALFDAWVSPHPFRTEYVAARDGRFLIHTVAGREPAVLPIDLIVNWKP